MFTAKAMQEHKSSEEAHETSANSKIVAFNKYKKINDTFPNTVKFLSKILSKKGMQDSSLQKYIITYLAMEPLFELKGYRSRQGFFLFTTGHQIVLMTKKEFLKYRDFLQNKSIGSIEFNPNPNVSFYEILETLINKILHAIETKRTYNMISENWWHNKEAAFKRVRTYGLNDQPGFVGELVPFKISPTQKFTLDIDRPGYIVLEEDFHSTFISSLLHQRIKKYYENGIVGFILVLTVAFLLNELK